MRMGIVVVPLALACLLVPGPLGLRARASYDENFR